MVKGVKGFQKGHPSFNKKTLFKKGMIPWNKGKKCPQLSGEKNGFYGKSHNSDTLEANRIKHLGISNPHSKESREKSRNSRINLFKKGFENPIRKGDTYEKVFGTSKANRIKEKQSFSLTGKQKSEEHIKKMKIARSKQVFPIKDTLIEIKIQNFLKRLEIGFFTHQYISEISHAYQCDIFIPSLNIIIECDGDYWHKYPVGRDIDKIRTKELIEKGFKVLRLWESEIKKMDLYAFKNKIK